MAIAPPLTLTRDSSQPSSRPTASTWPANASLTSSRSMSARVSPVAASSLRMANAGPMPMIAGSTPAVA